MKRTATWLFVVFLAIGIVVLIIRRPEGRPRSSQEKIAAQASNQPAPKVTGNQIAAGKNEAPQGLTQEAIMAAHRERSLRSIEFYGKVVDEAGEPVENADVAFQWNTLTEEGAPPRTLKSDGSGLFTIQGIRGKSLDVRITKAGYYPVKRKNQIAFEYAEQGERGFHVPNPQSPVIFYLKKRGLGSQLITSDKGMQSDFGFAVPNDGTPVQVDLLTRSVSASGHIEIRTQKEPKDIRTGKSNWSLRLIVPGGGLIEHDLEFPFEAPESGYRPEMQWDFAKDSTNWLAGFKKEFFVKFGTKPYFGRMRIRTSAFGTAMFIEYAVNPTGTRNLEFAQ